MNLGGNADSPLASVHAIVVKLDPDFAMSDVFPLAVDTTPTAVLVDCLVYLLAPVAGCPPAVLFPRSYRNQKNDAMTGMNRSVS